MRVLRVLTVSILLACLSIPASAQEFSKNPARFAPYKNHKFRVKWDGRYIPGIYKVSKLHRKTQVVRSRDGGHPSVDELSPGTTSHKPIVLVRGRTHDKSFEQWANKTFNYGAGLGNEASLGDLRKPVIVEVMNAAGQVVLRFNLTRCWPSEYVPITGLNANQPETLSEKLVLQCEGFQRDYALSEPQQPTYTKPEE